MFSNRNPPAYSNPMCSSYKGPGIWLRVWDWSRWCECPKGNISKSYSFHLNITKFQVVSRAFFQTLSCDQTPATESLKCNYTAPAQPGCRLIRPLTALCEWPTPSDSSIIGYQTILSSPHSTAKIGVASMHSPRMQFDNLLPNTDYRFRLQPVSDKGLIPPIDVEFTTSSDASEIDRRLDKFPILELPLESSSPSSCNCLFLAGLLILRILVL